MYIFFPFFFKKKKKLLLINKIFSFVSKYRNSLEPWTSDVRAAKLKAGTDLLVKPIERRRNHKFLMALCSIDNKTRQLTFIFPPLFPGPWMCHRSKLQTAGTRLTQMSQQTAPSETEVIDDRYIERGDQFLNFDKGGKRGVVLARSIFFLMISGNHKALIDRTGLKMICPLSIFMIKFWQNQWYAINNR